VFLGGAHRGFNDVADEANSISIVPAALESVWRFWSAQGEGQDKRWKELR
jgi:hypothetical protein